MPRAAWRSPIRRRPEHRSRALRPVEVRRGSSPATNIAAFVSRSAAVVRFSKPIVLKHLASRAPGRRSARSWVVLRAGSPEKRFMASITTRPASDGSWATTSATASQRRANMTTSAPSAASAGVVAVAPCAADRACRVFSLSGSRTPKTTSWRTFASAVPSPPPTPGALPQRRRRQPTRESTYFDS